MRPPSRPRPRRSQAPASRLAPGLEPCEPRLLMAVIPVVNNLDAGPGSLRAAITQANASAAPDVIQFRIDAGATVISPASPLPTITSPVNIDGTTQPGYAGGAPLVTIDGTNAGFIADGLTVRAGGTTVQALAIVRFNGNGITVSNAAGTVIHADYLGVDANQASAPNLGDGVFLTNSSGSVIGEPGAGNLIGANGGNGIHLGGRSSGALIQANFLGTTSARSGIGLGNPNVPNALDGILLEGATAVTIGGTAAGAGNVISGNGFNGVDLSGGSANLILGNLIGTDPSGLQGRANGGDGVVLGNSPNNTVGGADVPSGNVIAGNVGNGVTVSQAGSVGNLVFGNVIGLGLDRKVPLGNALNGVEITGAPSNAVIGNFVAGNGRAGLSINTPARATTPASGTLVRGNIIGLDVAGNRVSNLTDGVLVFQAPDNTIGGTSVADRNVISGNGGNGISFRGPNATRNLVQGNYIGTDASGQRGALVGNIIDGVFIRNSPGNTIGGTAVGAGNVIGQNRIGVDIETYDASMLGPDETALIGSRSDGNVIQGNKIGTDVTGTLPIGNYGEGVFIDDGSNNRIGGDVPGAGNLISANLSDGVSIISSIPSLDPTSGNLIQGNTIGLTADGANGLGNTQAGVNVIGGQATTIGGTTPLAGNVISGNVLGVHLLSFAPGVPMDLIVQGNIIGLGSDGLRADAADPVYAAPRNSSDGILFEQGAAGVTIGGDVAGAGNIISGNSSSGIRFASGATADLVQGNLIGVGRGGLVARPNNQSGLFVAEGSHQITIGGTTPLAGNVISGNSIGVTLTNAGTTGNLFQGNLIGLAVDGSTSVGNTAYGFLFLDGASNNTIGGTATGARNVISSNGQGIAINGPVVGGTVIQGNYLGTDASGSLGRGNVRVGIALSNSPGNTVGGVDPGAGNVISASGGPGIVLSGSLSSGNLIAGNLVGTDASGSRINNGAALPLGNAGFGIQVDNAPSNTIGGDTPGARNVVSGNGQAGIELNGFGASGNAIRGNLVGTDASGRVTLGNSADGILLNGAPDNVIGGTTGHEANVVSGNEGNGVQVAGVGSFSNAILGNLIGTDATGGLALGNTLSGVLVVSAPSVTIGGTIATLRNVISGNGAHGVRVAGTLSAGTVVLGNLIGTDATGRGPLGNAIDGILLDGAAAVTIGGTAPGSTNVLSANGSSGVEFGGASTYLNVVQGNLVGTDNTGMVALPNSIGLFLNNAPFNQVGGTAPFSGNLISGNAGPGVEVFGVAAIGNAIQGNRIGTDLAGLAALANQAGVFIDGSASNTVGGLDPNSGNLISGNLTAGVVLQGTGATRNLIQGNLIGPDITGARAIGSATGPVPQQQSGVLLTDAPGNVVGGSVSSGGNVVSGNVVGVVIAGFNARGNLVLGNLLGTEATGRFALGNVVGVYINGSSSNTIGGSTAGFSNLISGNTSTGITFFGPQTTRNVVSGNRIGTNLAGTAAVPNQQGVYIESSPSNTIGGSTPAAGNLISGNSVTGVYLFDGAAGNLIQGNRIGFTASGRPLGNLQYGVLLFNAANNTVDRSARTGNVIGNSGIGDFREFTGPAPTTTSTTTTSTTTTTAAKAAKKASHPAGPRALARK